MIKVLVYNVLTSTVIFVAIAATLGVINYRQDFRGEQDRLELFSREAAAVVDQILIQNRQLLETSVRFRPLVEALPLLQGMTEDRYRNQAAFVAPREMLAALSEEAGVNIVYVGSEDATAIFADRWVSLPADYDERQRSWYSATVDSGAFTVTDPYETTARASLRGERRGRVRERGR